MNVEIMREYKFDSAHHLPRVGPGHKCGQVHGHTYLLNVVVAGPVGSKTGWVMDFSELDLIVNPLVQAWDHHDLNEIVANPTAENLALFVLQYLSARLPAPLCVTEVVLSEGGRNRVRVRP